VEFHNNQHGKPKVSFEGISEDYKENDAVLFFDGQNFRLERLHRAMKRLRHVRLPGESTAAATSAPTALVGATAESYSPPLDKEAKVQSLNKGMVHQVPVSFLWFSNFLYFFQA
jgi:ELL-associated factor